MSRSTTYCASWRETIFTNSDGVEDRFDWIVVIPGDKSKVKCGLCLTSKPFSISSGGIADCRQHAKGKTHMKLVKERSKGTQTQLFSGSAGSPVWTETDKITKAEVLQALNTVHGNQSFASANGDAARFKAMFPDSPIVAKYHMEETKMKYLIQFGIAPYMKSCILKDVAGATFTFKFDETTTSQIKKQYDGYITYYSGVLHRVTTIYAGSLFVGHCKDVDLVDHFFDFMKELNLNTDYLLCLGMDGPNVNKSFERKLKKQLETLKGNSFLSVGSCPLHTVNNSFGAGMRVIKSILDIEQFLNDIHFFFKLSAARREDYKEICEVTDISSEFVLKYCSTRWLYISKVVVRVIEQYENLKEYFLVKLLTLPAFKGKQGVGSTERYQRIKKMFGNHLLLPAMSFIVYTSHIYRPFVLLFQREEPLIHILHLRMKKLVTDLLSNFLDPTYLSMLDTNSNGEIMVESLMQIDVKCQDKHKAKVDVGSKTKSLLSELDSLQKKKFMNEIATPFFIACAGYLLENLPLRNQLLIDVKYLHPTFREKSGGCNAIPRLAQNVVACLGNSVHEVFQIKKEVTNDELVDMICTEFRIYQIENIQENMFTKEAEESKKKKGNVQPSYWKYAYGLAGIDDYKAADQGDYNFRRIDEFWLSVWKFNDESTGELRYEKLCTLAMCLLVLPHGNAEPERGFSINKHLLKIHGIATKEATIVALRTVKDEIIRFGGVLNIDITKELLKSCQAAKKGYDAYLDAEKDKAKQEEKRRMEAAALKEVSNEKEELRVQLKQSKCDLDTFRTHIKAAEEVISEGNEEMGKCLALPVASINKNKLKMCQSKITMGLKRKSKLDEEVVVIEKKIRKLEEKISKSKN